jgi:NADPH:quinone reductase-like Zn-dependent oxidoreductase
MKAIVCTKYGFPKPYKLKEIDMPVPGNNEVLVKIHAASVTYSNQIFIKRRFLPMRLLFGKRLISASSIPGTDMSGTVVETGEKVRLFKTGDEVFGDMSLKNLGAYAEYTCASEDLLAVKPKNLSFVEAASMPEAALVALQSLRDYGNITKGQKVLVYGAAGGIGTLAVQIAKYYGAEVTGICSTRNVDFLRSLSADHVIDYTKEDFGDKTEKYDLIFTIRKSPPVKAINRALKTGGICVSTGSASPARLIQEFSTGPRLLKKENKKIVVMTTRVNRGDLEFIRELVEAGRLKPVIDRIFPLHDIEKAFHYYGKGHARGKVVISI